LGIVEGGEGEDKEEEGKVLTPIITFSNMNSETFLSDNSFFSDGKINPAIRSFLLFWLNSIFSQPVG
jgi:hypothetical protein